MSLLSIRENALKFARIDAILYLGERVMKKVLIGISVVSFCVAMYFGSREWVSLFWIIPLCLLCVSGIDKVGATPCLLGVIAVCIGSIFWVNSVSPIWGDRYESKMEYERLKSAANEDENAKIRKISTGQVAVKGLLKDPSSAEFSGDYVGKSGAVCGYVNAKNSFGAYSGKDRYIYNGGAYIDDGGKDFSSLWRKLCR